MLILFKDLLHSHHEVCVWDYWWESSQAVFHGCHFQFSPAFTNIKRDPWRI